MFLLLMKIRLQCALNVMRETLRRRPLFATALTLLSAALFLILYYGFRIFFDVAHTLNVLPQCIHQTLYYLFLFLFAGAVPFVASTLLQSSDYSLLFASPVSPRAIIASKLIDATVTNSLQFSLLGIPALVACGGALGLPFWDWLLLPIVVLLFALLPALLTSLGLMLMLAGLGMRRLRSAVTLLNAVTGALICITVVSRVGSGSTEMGINGVLSGHVRKLTETASLSGQSPSQLFSDLLLNLASGAVVPAVIDFAVILFIVAGLFALCLALGSRLLSAATVAEESDAGPAPLSSTALPEARSARLPPGPIAATFRKDFRFLCRDTVLLSQLAMPLILYTVPFVLNFSERSLRDLMFPLALMMVGIILFMQTSILSLSSIGLESRAFWVMKVSPIPIRTVLWSKFLWSALFSGGISGVLVLISGSAFQQPLGLTLMIALLFVIVSAGLCGLGVGISATFPRFVYDNPALRVSAWALILGFVFSTAYLMLTGAILILTWWLSTQLGIDLAHQMLIYVGGGTLFLILTLLSVIIPIHVGAERIEGYPWEH